VKLNNLTLKPYKAFIYLYRDYTFQINGLDFRLSKNGGLSTIITTIRDKDYELVSPSIIEEVNFSSGAFNLFYELVEDKAYKCLNKYVKEIFLAGSIWNWYYMLSYDDKLKVLKEVLVEYVGG